MDAQHDDGELIGAVPVALRRTDSAVSARDSKYWLSIASQSSHPLSTAASPTEATVSDCRSSVLLNYAAIPAFHATPEQSSVKETNITSPPVASNGLQMPTPPPMPANDTVVMEQVHENQRYQLVLGWGSKGHLLPLDPGKYMLAIRRPKSVRRRNDQETEPGQRRRSISEYPQQSTDKEEANAVEWIYSATFPDITLPNNPSFTSTKWEWISPWHLEKQQDTDGWQYATSFQQFETPDAISATWKPKHYVRRRQWIRFRRLKTSEDAESSAFDDTFLDSMAGYLRKRGHVRKNWKSRYFVLEKSILRYYTDESMQKLKGEVLLFHPATTVQHYVDNGKEFGFSITVGPDYTLLLQADRLADREHWMYCIEDALLCRDSYHLDPEASKDWRESVARRRQRSTQETAGLNPVNLFVVHAKRPKNPQLVRLLQESDTFLSSKAMKEQIATFIARFKQKYTAAPSPLKPTNGGVVPEDVRSALALKNYRFFIERSLAQVLEHVLPLVRVEDQASEDVETMKKAALYTLECETFLPLQSVIHDLLQTTTTIHELEVFERNRRYLSTQDQRFFDIPASHVSSSEWKRAIQTLNTIDGYSLPSEKASILLDVAKCMYETHAQEHHQDPQMMTADDFLPIFIFILTRATVQNVMQTRQLISETMISAVMIGETGYYATMLEAAIGYIASYVVPIDDLYANHQSTENRDKTAQNASDAARRSLTRLSLSMY